MLNQKKFDTKVATFLNGILDTFYPVGSYYETSDGSFNPNVSWGGTWVLETAGTFHLSAGTGYTLGGTGGSKYIQQHQHSGTYSNPSVSGTGSATITGGPHAHQYGYLTYKRGGGDYDTRVGPYGYNSSGVTKIGSSETTHTHSLPAHTHTLRGGGYTVGNVKSVTAGDGGNLPPYVAVNRWHRTA